MGDDPPYLVVGTEVSAKYKGAFCEAKIKKITRSVKCRVTFKGPGLGTVFLQDDQIKGALKVGAVVEAKHPTQASFAEGTINKIQDCSLYTVVFDDGDITTLRRSALCLKSGRHFNESETLDQLPLTHPEHFSNPVMGGRRAAVAKRAPATQVEDTSDDEDVAPRKKKRKGGVVEVDLGKVVCVDNSEKKKAKDGWFPAVVVHSSAQPTIKIKKDEVLVRSFRDTRYYTVPKKELTLFAKESARTDGSTSVLKSAIEKATNYIEKDELPAHWDREILFPSEHSKAGVEDVDPAETSEPESLDEAAEEKKRFMAELNKFMEAKGTPINKEPVVCNKELDLHKLYNLVREKGGYTKASSGNQWKLVIQTMGFGVMPSTSTINQIKQAYKRFLHDFEEDMEKKSSSAAAISSRARASRTKIGRKGAATKQTKEEESPVEVKAVKSDENEPESSDETFKKIMPLETSRRSRSRQDLKLKTQAESEPPKEDSKKSTSRDIQMEEQVVPSSEQPSTLKTPRSKSKRPTKEDLPVPEEPILEKEALPERKHVDQSVKIGLGDRLRVYYGPKADGKVTYEAKVIDTDEQKKLFLVHYTGWNTRYDEWISILRISENLSLTQDGPQTSAPQGRGPMQSLDSASEESTSPGKAGRSARSKRLSPAPSETGSGRNKVATIRKKRKSEDVSSDSQLTDDLNKTAEHDSESSSAPASNLTEISTTESSLDEVISPGKFVSRKIRSSAREKDHATAAQTRLELKGLPSAHGGQESHADADVYEFQDDLTETPRFKTISPRSPSGKKEEASKDHDTADSLRKPPEVDLTQEASGNEITPQSLKNELPIIKVSATELERSTKGRAGIEVKDIGSAADISKGRKRHGSKTLQDSTQPLKNQGTSSIEAQVSLPSSTLSRATSKKSHKEPPEVSLASRHMPTQSDSKIMADDLPSETKQKEKQESADHTKRPSEAISHLVHESIVLEEEPAPQMIAPEEALERFKNSQNQNSSGSGKTVTKRTPRARKNTLPSKSASPSPRKGAAGARKRPPPNKALPSNETFPFPVELLDDPKLQQKKFGASDKPMKHEKVAESGQLATANLQKETSPIRISADPYKPPEVEGDRSPVQTVPKKEKALDEIDTVSREVDIVCEQQVHYSASTSELVTTEGTMILSVADIIPTIHQEESKSVLPLESPSDRQESTRPPAVEVQLKIEAMEKNEIGFGSLASISKIATHPEESKAIEEPCSSLLCEEEIPKSPPPNESASDTEISNLKSGFDAEILQDDRTDVDHFKPEKDRKGAEADQWKSKVEDTKTSSHSMEEGTNLFDVYSPSGAKGSAAGIDSTPPATPDSTNSGNVSSDFGDCEADKPYRTSKRMKLIQKGHSDTDSAESTPRPEHYTEDDGSMPMSKIDDTKYKTSGEHESSKRDSVNIERPTRRRRASRRSEDEYGSISRSKYRMQEADMENDFGFTGFTLDLPPMTIPMPMVTSKYCFIPELGDDLTPEKRISIITTNIQNLKETYASLKSSLAGIDRKRKKLKRRDREKDVDGLMERVSVAVAEEVQLSPTL